jgi:glutathione S-transferase
MSEVKPWFVTESDSTITVKFGPYDDETTDKSPSIPRWTVAYWSIRGLGAPIRMMLCAAKQDFTCRLYDVQEKSDGGWTSHYRDKYKPELLEQYTPFMNLPYIVDDLEHVVLAQTNSCLQYFGEQLGMMGKTRAEYFLCVQLLSEVYDIRNVMVQFAYGGRPEDAATTVHEALRYFKKFDAYLQAKENKAFIIGDTFSAVDFPLFEMIDQFTNLCQCYELDEFLNNLPNVRKFYKDFSLLGYVLQCFTAIDMECVEII